MVLFFCAKFFDMNKNVAIDQYIAKAADFAKPVLEEIRYRVHLACPEATEDTKWQFPHFMYKGKILCSMASFKQHCSFGFWLAPLMKNQNFKMGAMGDLGKMTSINDLPSEKEFSSMIQEAMKLIDEGKTLLKKADTASKIVPSKRLLQALKEHPEIEARFENFTPGKKAEYHQWINEAKTEPTVQKRTATALDWISEGKALNWKYMK